MILWQTIGGIYLFFARIPFVHSKVLLLCNKWTQRFKRNFAVAQHSLRFVWIESTLYMIHKKNTIVFNKSVEAAAIAFDVNNLVWIDPFEMVKFMVEFVSRTNTQCWASAQEQLARPHIFTFYCDTLMAVDSFREKKNNRKIEKWKTDEIHVT